VLCTYIRDSYRNEEASELADAIDDIASPIDQNGWASAGIYCFWDTSNNEVLYIGLAVNLSSRFRQHNGLISCPEKGCKRELINRWFESNEELGYSILVQSKLSQPAISNNTKEDINDEFKKKYPQLFYGIEAIQFSEGLLIEAENILNSSLPPWNRIGGSKSGALKASNDNVYLSKLFTNEITDLYVAMRTIRQISSNPTFEAYELYLHGVRLFMAVHDASLSKAWEMVPDFFEEKNRIISEEYIPGINELLSE
tara:strand:- start:530 stop:1294 length:765 start_codon:yes stop_codon:yes gene_type:complete